MIHQNNMTYKMEDMTDEDIVYIVRIMIVLKKLSLCPPDDLQIMMTENNARTSWNGWGA